MADIKKRFCQIWKSQVKNLIERESIYGRYKDVGIAIFQSFLARKTQNVLIDGGLLKKSTNFCKGTRQASFQSIKLLNKKFEKKISSVIFIHLTYVFKSPVSVCRTMFPFQLCLMYKELA